MAASVASAAHPHSAARPEMVGTAVMAASVAPASFPRAPSRFSTPEPFGVARERVAVLVASVVRPEATARLVTAGREAAADPPGRLAPGEMARTALLVPAVPATASPVETAALVETVALQDSGEQVVRDLARPRTERMERQGWPAVARAGELGEPVAPVTTPLPMATEAAAAMEEMGVRAALVETQAVARIRHPEATVELAEMPGFLEAVPMVRMAMNPVPTVWRVAMAEARALSDLEESVASEALLAWTVWTDRP
jgi:hypothetical protein